MPMGISQDATLMRLSSGEPIWFQLQLVNQLGYPESLANRSFTLAIYELNGAPKATVTGVSREDATGRHLLFNVGGDRTAKWPDQHDLRWEISERRGDGKLLVLSGQMIVDAGSKGVVGDQAAEPALMPRIERGFDPAIFPMYPLLVRNVPRADQLAASA